MPATTEERLERVDREVVDLKQSFVDAIQHLQGTPEIDSSFDQRLQSVAARFRQLRTDLRPEDFDKAQLNGIVAVASRSTLRLDNDTRPGLDDRDRRYAAVLSEELRHA